MKDTCNNFVLLSIQITIVEFGLNKSSDTDFRTLPSLERMVLVESFALETVLKSVSKEKLTNFEKTNLTYEKTDKKKK